VKKEGWNYSEELTNKYVRNISGWSPVALIPCNWSVYKRVGEDSNYPSDRNVRIYAQPVVPHAGWVLIAEGYADSKGNMKVW